MWGLSILIGSICFLFVLITKLVVQEPGELIAALLALILLSGVFSWPTFLLSYLLIKYLSGKGVPIKSIRIDVYFLVLTGILLTVIFFEPTIFEDYFSLAGLICYVIGLTISVFTLKIDPPVKN